MCAQRSSEREGIKIEVYTARCSARMRTRRRSGCSRSDHPYRSLARRSRPCQHTAPRHSSRSAKCVAREPVAALPACPNRTGKRLRRGTWVSRIARSKTVAACRYSCRHDGRSSNSNDTNGPNRRNSSNNDDGSSFAMPKPSRPRCNRTRTSLPAARRAPPPRGRKRFSKWSPTSSSPQTYLANSTSSLPAVGGGVNFESVFGDFCMGVAAARHRLPLSSGNAAPTARSNSAKRRW
jgi:hypothetical protein